MIEADFRITTNGEEFRIEHRLRTFWGRIEWFHLSYLGYFQARLFAEEALERHKRNVLRATGTWRPA